MRNIRAMLFRTVAIVGFAVLTIGGSGGVSSGDAGRVGDESGTTTIEQSTGGSRIDMEGPTTGTGAGGTTDTTTDQGSGYSPGETTGAGTGGSTDADLMRIRSMGVPGGGMGGPGGTGSPSSVPTDTRGTDTGGSMDTYEDTGGAMGTGTGGTMDTEPGGSIETSPGRSMGTPGGGMGGPGGTGSPSSVPSDSGTGEGMEK